MLTECGRDSCINFQTPFTLVTHEVSIQTLSQLIAASFLNVIVPSYNERKNIKTLAVICLANEENV